MPEAYCVKCKTKREMKDPKEITMKNNKPATQGTCPKCGTKMFKIGSAKSAAAPAPAPAG
jgi:RNase P subunit RPR2